MPSTEILRSWFSEQNSRTQSSVFLRLPEAKMWIRDSIALLAIAVPLTAALDNGLALKPPMGWISWERFRCEIDCDQYPNDCISENLYKRIADELVDGGYRDVGYVHVNIDDCWALKERDSNGRMVADPKRFPSGMKGLAKYMHDRGLKLGIYSDAGSKTCAGYPGSRDYEDIDAQTYADWDIDMLKYDGCFIANEADIPNLYMKMTQALNKTGKQIVYSCEWPLYQKNTEPDWGKIAASCNLWRNYDDIADTFESVKRTIDVFVKNQDLYVKHQKPGAFFDPDMLILGDYGLSKDEARVQMAIWAIWGAPLFMSNDLAKIDEDSKKLLLNRGVIGINQDPEGIMGKMIKQARDVRIFAKPILPKSGSSYSFGLALINLSDGGNPQRVNQTASEYGLTDPRGYRITDEFDNLELGIVKPGDFLAIDVNPSGARLLKAVLMFSTPKE
ncbi:alpha-N-acetylgalactosaminidase [Galendromus occidentalis]|uniref:Alpha-galactosidase n=1 Tax=Galendromus occidentalis TaxID=34638 RepID=A0AAJ7L448_9ACAR|nr:alpha-N-acetylgalactosaminidase [Galendromus occidentalis]